MSQVFLTDGPSWPAGQGKKHGLISLFLLSVFRSVRGKMVGLSSVCLSPLDWPSGQAGLPQGWLAEGQGGEASLGSYIR